MRICVYGLWHLGTVTAACLASKGFDVTGLDPDEATVRALQSGKLPVAEPGLLELTAEGVKAKKLAFDTDARSAVGRADVLWVTFDTPVDAEDRADTALVIRHVSRVLDHLSPGAVVLISSQLPVGSTSALQDELRKRTGRNDVGFAYCPENLRLGKAVETFLRADRFVVGCDRAETQEKLAPLFAVVNERVEWMSVQSAEMVKHAINSFLALSVAFINEVAVICEAVGADAKEVERGLKSESRIGPRAYLSPGAAFAGGTLARDITFLSELSRTHGVPAHLVNGVLASNRAHMSWTIDRASTYLGDVEGVKAAVWGLTYKPGTDTLRRSSSVELCRELAKRGATVVAFDPAVKELPDELRPIITLAATPEEAVKGASVLVVGTEWPELREVRAESAVMAMTRPLVLDPTRFLERTIGQHPAVEYVTIGKANVSTK